MLLSQDEMHFDFQGKKLRPTTDPRDREIISWAVQQFLYGEVTGIVGPFGRLTARTSALGYASMLAFAPLLLWLGVRSRVAMLAFLGAAAVAALVSFGVMRRGRPRGRHVLYVLAASTLAFALGSSMYGPLVLVPTMIATNTMALALHLDGRARR